MACNPQIIENIRQCSDEESLKIITNGGSLVYDQIGKSKYLPIDMHYNPDSIANVFSLKSVADLEGIDVRMNTGADRSISVHAKERVIMVFNECSSGL